MYNKNIKLVIAALIVGTAIWQMIEGYIGNGIMLILLASVFVFLYFKNELILLAFLRLRKQDFPGAKKWLDKIKNPESALTTKQQGYYNYLLGIMLSQTNITQAEKYLKKAIKLGLSMNQDLAVAKLNLAGIAMTKRRKREAQNLLTEAKKLDKHGMLKRANLHDETTNEKNLGTLIVPTITLSISFRGEINSVLKPKNNVLLC